MSKYFLATSVALLMVFVVVGSVFGQCEEPIPISLDPASAEIPELGGTTTISLITGAVSEDCGEDGVFAFQANIVYDPAVLSIARNDIDFDGGLVDGWFTEINVSTPGVLVVNGFSTQPLVGEGLMFTMTWTGLDNGLSNLDVSFTYNEGDPAVDVSGGMIVVGSGPGCIEPIAITLNPDYVEIPVEGTALIALNTGMVAEDCGEDGVFAFEANIQYDSAVLSITRNDIDFDGGLVDGWFTEINVDVPGVLVVNGFSTQPLVGEGMLFTMNWTGLIDGTSDLTVDFQYNEGDPTVDVSGGTIVVGEGGSPCDNAMVLACDDVVEGSTVGGNSYWDAYSCTSWPETGPEVVYSLMVDENVTSFTATLSNLEGGDLDVFILGSCDANDCLASGNFEATLESPVPGQQYYVVVDGYNGGEGSYTLSIECATAQECPDPYEPNNNADEAYSIMADEPLTEGIIEPENDEDWFTFEGTEGDLAIIDIDARNLDPASTLDSYLYLLDDQGELLAANDDYDGRDSHIEFELPYTGTYYTYVRDYFNSGGCDYFYHISLTFDSFVDPDPNEPNDTAEEATSIEIDGEIGGWIIPEGDVDWFSFMGNAGEGVLMFTERVGDSQLDPEIYLYGPDDYTLYITNDDDSHGDLQPEIELVLPADGMYWIRLAHYTNDPELRMAKERKMSSGLRATTGEYTLYLQSVERQPIDIVLGSTVILGPFQTGNTSLITGMTYEGDGVVSFDASISYDPAVVTITADDMMVGDLLEGWVVQANDSQPGLLLINAFSTTPLVGEGTLLDLTWTGVAPGTTDLGLDFVYNEGTPEVTVTGGLAVVGDASPPAVTYSPESFDFVLKQGLTGMDVLTIGNEGEAPLTFTVEDDALMRMLMAEYEISDLQRLQDEQIRRSQVDAARAVREAIHRPFEANAQRTVAGLRDALWYEDFDASEELPEGWTTVLEEGAESNNIWFVDDYNDLHMNVAGIEYGNFGDRVHASLISPSADASGVEHLYLNFWMDLRGGYENDPSSYTYAYVEGSLDGGQTWDVIDSWELMGNELQVIGYASYDITEWGAGQSDITFRFRYDSEYDWWWYIDNVALETESVPTDWLSADPVSGTVEPGESMDVMVIADASQLEIDQYRSNLMITTNDPFTPAFWVPVTLEVIPYTVDISIPQDLLAETGTSIMVPLYATDLTADLEVIGFNLELGYDPTVLSATGYSDEGTITEGWTFSFNNSSEGSVLLSGFDISPADGEGVFVYLIFDVIGAPTSTSELNFVHFQLNEGDPASLTEDGFFTVDCPDANEPNDLVEDATPAMVGGVVDGCVFPEGDVDWFSFEGLAGQHISVYDLGNVDAALYLYGPNGELLGTNDDDIELGNCNPRVMAFLPEAGTYTVRLAAWTNVPEGSRSTGKARACGDVVGEYQFYVEELPVIVDIQDVAEIPYGDTGPVSFYLMDSDSLMNIVSFEFTLHYDPTVVSVYDIMPGDILTEDWTVQYDDNGEGMVMISGFGTQGIRMDGHFLLAYFASAGAVADESILSIDPIMFNDGFPAGAGVDGSVIITGALISVEPEMVEASVVEREVAQATVTVTNGGNAPMTVGASDDIGGGMAVMIYPPVRNERSIGGDVSKRAVREAEFVGRDLSGLAKGEKDSYEGAGVLRGAGGPDLYGYVWMDSNEPGGPSYDWVNVPAMPGAVAVPTSDDGNEGPFPLGFDVVFYGNTFNEIRVGMNGYLTFTSTLADYSNSCIGEADGPENMIAPFWDDLAPHRGNGSVWYYSSPDMFVMQWNEVPKYYQTGSLTFQAIIYPDGRIKFQYADMGNGALLNSATIGIENGDATDGLQIACNEDYIPELPTLDWLFVSPDVAFIEPGMSADFTVTMDAADLLAGMYAGNLIFASNAVNEPELVVPVNLEVTPGPYIAVDPPQLAADAEVGSMTTQTFTVSNTGGATLDFEIMDDIGGMLARAAQISVTPSVHRGQVELPEETPKYEEKDPTRGIGTPALRGMGEDGTFGYSWKDSYEADGPVFDYIDISATGTLVTGLGDDNSVGPFPLGIEFPFYDEVYTEFYLGSNGLLGFGSNTSLSSLSNRPIPTTSTPNNILAWCWDDLDPANPNTAVYYQTIDDMFVIQFVNYYEYPDGGDAINAEVILYSDGSIKIQYDSMDEGFDTLSATVGIENIDGTDGLEIVYNAAYIEPQLAVMIYSPWYNPGDGVPVVYDYLDISGTGTLVTGLGDDNYVGPFPIGFDFDFYGTVYSEFYIGSNGVVGFDPTSLNSLSNSPIPTSSSPNAILPWFWDDMDPADTNAPVYYQTMGDMLVIQFVDYIEYPGNQDPTNGVNAEIILYADGSIVYQYQSFGENLDITSCTIGIEDPTGTSGVEIFYNNAPGQGDSNISGDEVPAEFVLENEFALMFEPNGDGTYNWYDSRDYEGGGGEECDWLMVDPVMGSIEGAGSFDVTVTFDASCLVEAGLYNGTITILSNAYNTPELTIPVDFTVYGQPTLEAIAKTDGYVSLMWELPGQLRSLTGFEIYRGGSRVGTVGPDQNTFNDYNVTPGWTYTYQVAAVYDGAPGMRSSVAEVTVLSAPDLNAPVEFAAEVSAGEVQTISMPLSNLGEANLYVDRADIVGMNPAYAYPYYAYQAQYDWMEIDPAYDGNGTPVLNAAGNPLGDDDRGMVTLPFNFTYYGESYNTLWICSNGWMSLGDDPGNNSLSSSPIPTMNLANNLIAPLWDDLNPSAAGGIFVYDDGNGTFVVEFSRVPHFGSSTQRETFQVLFKSNGDLVFQYRTAPRQTDLSIGIENMHGTKGLQYYYNGTYADGAPRIRRRTAIRFSTTPVELVGHWLTMDEHWFMIPGGTSHNMMMTVDATDFESGDTYQTTLQFRSNDPNQRVVDVPVTITVGAPAGPANLMAEAMLDEGTIHVSWDSAERIGGERDITPLTKVAAASIGDNAKSVAASKAVQQDSDLRDIRLLGYNLYRRLASEEEWTLIWTGRQTSYVDENVEFGVEYCYGVAARYNVGNSDIVGPECAILDVPAELVVHPNFEADTDMLEAFFVPIDDEDVSERVAVRLTNPAFDPSATVTVSGVSGTEGWLTFDDAQIDGGLTLYGQNSDEPSSAVVYFIFDFDQDNDDMIDGDVVAGVYNWTVTFEASTGNVEMPVELEISDFFSPADFNGDGYIGGLDDVLVIYYALNSYYDPATGQVSGNWNPICNIGIYAGENGSAPILAGGGADNIPSGRYRINLADLTLFALYYDTYAGASRIADQAVDHALVHRASSAPVYHLESLTGSRSFVEGEEYTFSIIANEAIDLFATSLEVEYDAAQFELVRVEEGSFLRMDGTPTLFFHNDVEQGTVRIDMTRLGAAAGGVNGEGVLANVTFRARFSGETELTLKSDVSMTSRGQQLAEAVESVTELEISSESKQQTPSVDVPVTYDMAQNTPNPFNPTTSIRYQLPVKAHVNLEIYNAAGQLVKTLVNAPREAGYYTATWDGTDELGNAVASGVYVYRITAGDFSMTRSMVMLK